MEMRNLVFSNDGIELRGWLAQPKVDSSCPLIILTHGLSGVIDMDLERYAEVFTAGGFACLAYDHRNWGRSGGSPRGETDPWRQVADLREAISYARMLPGIDPDRIGLWGTSYAGGHVLTTSALDRRVRCVVAQVPLTHGSRTFDAWVPADKRDKFIKRLDDDRDRRRHGEAPLTTVAALPASETDEWVQRNDVHGSYRNELTIRTFDLLRTYEPAAFVERIAPTPLLMIVATNDMQTPNAWQREAFAQIGQPKRLLEIDCRHYDVYMDRLGEAAAGALAWYEEHL
jgi:fermentation-respiration switch protein FrsA (DUF1100 family)